MGMRNESLFMESETLHTQMLVNILLQIDFQRAKFQKKNLDFQKHAIIKGFSANSGFSEL